MIWPPLFLDLSCPNWESGLKVEFHAGDSSYLSSLGSDLVKLSTPEDVRSTRILSVAFYSHNTFNPFPMFEKLPKK